MNPKSVEFLRDYNDWRRSDNPWTFALPSQIGEAIDWACEQIEQHAALSIPRPADEWHEDMGCVLWWILPVCEPPWCGQPHDSDWPGCHTHWTPLPPPPGETK